MSYKRLVLAPFNMEREMLYHQITWDKIDCLEYKSIIWFDNDTNLWGRMTNLMSVYQGHVLGV